MMFLLKVSFRRNLPHGRDSPGRVNNKKSVNRTVKSPCGVATNLTKVKPLSAVAQIALRVGYQS
jgi:hypothetical protein